VKPKAKPKRKRRTTSRIGQQQKQVVNVYGGAGGGSSSSSSAASAPNPGGWWQPPPTLPTQAAPTTLGNANDQIDRLSKRIADMESSKKQNRIEPAPTRQDNIEPAPPKQTSSSTKKTLADLFSNMDIGQPAATPSIVERSKMITGQSVAPNPYKFKFGFTVPASFPAPPKREAPTAPVLPQQFALPPTAPVLPQRSALAPSVVLAGNVPLPEDDMSWANEQDPFLPGDDVAYDTTNESMDGDIHSMGEVGLQPAQAHAPPFDNPKDSVAVIALPQAAGGMTEQEGMWGQWLADNNINVSKDDNDMGLANERLKRKSKDAVPGERTTFEAPSQQESGLTGIVEEGELASANEGAIVPYTPKPKAPLNKTDAPPKKKKRPEPKKKPEPENEPEPKKKPEPAKKPMPKRGEYQPPVAAKPKKKIAVVIKKPALVVKVKPKPVAKTDTSRAEASKKFIAGINDKPMKAESYGLKTSAAYTKEGMTPDAMRRMLKKTRRKLLRDVSPDKVYNKNNKEQAAEATIALNEFFSKAYGITNKS